MAARLPTPGGDNGNWGKILNDYLRVEHNSDGTLKNVARRSDLDGKADKSELVAKADLAELGTAATQDVEVFATADQGAKADAAIKHGDTIDGGGSSGITTLQLRRGTAAQWSLVNPVLASGELGLEIDTGKRKVGNGAQSWATLPYDLTKSLADELYATIEQGGKAETAVQPEALEPLTPGPGEVVVGGPEGVSLRDLSAINAPRSPAPVAARGEVIADMSPDEGWIRTNGSTEFSVNDTTDMILGDRHAWVETINGAGNLVALGISGLSLNLMSSILHIPIKLDNPERTGNFLRATFISHSGTRQIDFRNNREPGWFTLAVDPLESARRTDSGTPDMSNVTGIRIGFRGLPGHDRTRCRVGGIIEVPRVQPNFPNGVVSFTFDDNFISQYTKAAPILSAHNFPATAYTIAEVVGMSSSFMSLDQLKTLHTVHGWEIGSHAFTQANHNAGFTTLSDEQLHEEFTRNKEWILKHGLGHGENFAWPLGELDARTLEIASQYFRSSRRTAYEAWGQTLWMPRGYQMQALRPRGMDGTANPGAWQPYIDDGYEYGQWIIVYGHHLNDDSAAPLTAKTSEFKTLVDYIASKGMPVMTVGDVLSKLSFP